MTRALPLRWRQVKGRRYGPNTHALWRGEKYLATAQQINGGDKWFWYGLGCNTSNRPAALSAVKLEAMTRAREVGE